ncbi:MULTISPECIES: diiron oxygenase [unclassified Rhodococcus (in: high G+C Gram-positive bacteria)]|uniref:AurF N-oxygenase family protein n=1 Tax=unclassified Rhodococcus (in: high G+C Gram-positive bacteria) TaxID=192944 RepID=UPI00163B3993|nr:MULTISPECIES: diiron oxygenase [unclassified Rhodococcus (in: high G+C Gram-positive bacteria)]MBC2642435.1 diiron oxygenase [Rhodococcus sp. 3A]MBC2892822.1 diiron oxygenase [Rhodococcus sp. 4CII]
MTASIVVSDREETAQRLLASSARKSYDPMVEVDWEAPIPDDKFGLTPEWSTLYGTALWDEMTDEQKIELTKHEAASVSSVGLWFEILLMQMLLRDVYGRDKHSRHVQFALTEVADECRHSVMFARAGERLNMPSYGPHPAIHKLGRIWGGFFRGANAYASVMAAEEILDMMQRDFMKDERVQPVTRTVSKIHVLEEARHIRFAREEVGRRIQGASWARLQIERLNTAAVVYFVMKSMIRKEVYENAGLDPKRAAAEAKNNQHYKDTVRTSGSKLMQFLDSVGLVGGPSKRLYKRVHLL